MTCELDPVKIAQLLTQGTRQLDATTVSALFSARQNALKIQSSRASAFSLDQVSTHSSIRWAVRLIPHSAQAWVAGGLLIAALVGGTAYWQNVQEQQTDETDVAILTDELPIEVFVD